MSNKMKFDIKFEEVTPVNSLFSKAKVYVMYHGDNRNFSAMEKKVVEEAIPTLFLCPVIGEYNETIEDFKGHGGKIEISSEGVKYIQTTKPYGVVPNDAEVAWEFVTEKDGTVHEYLTCEVYLWTGRYPEALTVIENSKGQSMEIAEVEGKERKDGYFEISKFTFSGLCILGDGCEPCFESSSITAYTLNKDLFNKEFNLMVKELKETLNSTTIDNNQTGGVQMENEFEQGLGKEGNEDETSNQTENFALTIEQKKSEIRRNLRTSTYVDRWGYEYSKYYYVDYDSEYVYAKDDQEGFLVKLTYTETGDVIALDFNSVKKVKIVYSDIEDGATAPQFELITSDKKEEELQNSIKVKEDEFSTKIGEKDSEISNLNTEITGLKDNYSALENEIKELRDFKLSTETEKVKEEKESVFQEFSVGLTEDEMKPVKDEMDNLAVSDIESKLSAIFAKKNLEKLKSENSEFAKETDTMVADVMRKDQSKSRYAV